MNLYDVAGLVNRRWSFGPATSTMKNAFAVFTEFRPDRLGLNVAWIADDSETQVEFVVGPFAVSLHGPPLPGADDDFEQMASVDVAGHTVSAYWTRTFVGFDAAYARPRAGGLMLHVKAGPVGVVVDPVEQVS